MRKTMAALLVVAVLLVGFAAGFMRPAKAATPPLPSQQVKVNSALVCVWVPRLHVGLC